MINSGAKYFLLFVLPAHLWRLTSDVWGLFIPIRPFTKSLSCHSRAYH